MTHRFLTGIVVLGLVCGAFACKRDGASKKKDKAAAVDKNKRRATSTIIAEMLGAAATLPRRSELEARAEGETVTTGGVLRVRLEAEPAHLNPLLENNRSIWRVTDRLVYEPLYDCSAGAPGEAVPLLAAGPPALEGGAEPVLTVELKSGVKFHDGKSLSAVDVQATFEPLLRNNTKRPLLRQALSDVASIEVRGERRIAFRLHRTSHLVAGALCEVPIVPEALVRGGATDRANLGRIPVGTGPMQVVSWDRGKRISLERNRDYAGAAMALDGIHFEIETDGAKAMTLIKRDRLDLLPAVLDRHFPDQLENVVLADSLVLLRLQPPHYSFLAFNTRNDPVSDVRFRQALTRLWDRNRHARELRKGLARAISGPPAASGQAAKYDREAAKALLDQVGYTDTNDDGVRDRNGQAIRLRMVFVSGSKTLAREAHLFSLDLRRAGLLLDLVPVDAATFEARLAEGNFDLAPLGWEGRDHEDPRLLYAPDSPFNHTGYQSGVLDALLDELLNTPALNERQRLIERIGEFVADEMPVMFLYRHDKLGLVSHRVRGLSGEGAFLDLRGVWLDKS